MKASTLFLGFTLVVLAAALAGLWQSFARRSGPPASSTPPVAEAPARREPRALPVPSEPEEPGVRSVYPGARPSAARAPQPEAPPAATPTRAAPVPTQDSAPPAAPERSAALQPPGLDTPDPPAPAEAPAVGEGVDLNTAPLEALNALGAGMIGKTIIANRPYAAPEDLVTRRVLKRQDFETIRPRVVVR